MSNPTKKNRKQRKYITLSYSPVLTDTIVVYNRHTVEQLSTTSAVPITTRMYEWHLFAILSASSTAHKALTEYSFSICYHNQGCILI